jgi:hypothetical protein
MTLDFRGGGSGRAGRKMVGRKLKSGMRLVFYDLFVGHSRMRLDQ